MFPTTITQKGQVTIPVAIREMVNLKPRQKVMVTVHDDAVMIKPAVNFSSLRGSIKGKLATKKEMREAVGKYLGQRHQNIMKYGSRTGR